MYSAGSNVQYPQQGYYPKPRSANEKITCKFCDITVKGADQYNSHVSGSKHARKIKEHENTKKAKRTPYLEYDECSGAYECTACRVSLNSSSVAMFHVVGNRHVEAVKAIETAQIEMYGNDYPREVSLLQESGLPTEFRTTKVEPSNNPSLHQTPATNKTKARPNIGPNFMYSIKPLASNFVSKYTTHTVEATVPTSLLFGGRQRKKPNGDMMKSGVQSFPCLACNILTNSETQLQAHLSSERHKSRLGSVRTNGRTPKDHLPPTSPGFRCESCRITVNSQIQLDQHLQSQKHRLGLQKRYQPYPPHFPPPPLTHAFQGPPFFTPGPRRLY